MAGNYIAHYCGLLESAQLPKRGGKRSAMAAAHGVELPNSVREKGLNSTFDFAICELIFSPSAVRDADPHGRVRLEN